MATKPVGKDTNAIHRNQRVVSKWPRKRSQLPNQLTASITRPMPTIIRKVKNGIRIGGQFSRGMLSSPTSPAVRLPESMRLPHGGGSVIAKRFRWFSTSGQASSTSEAGFSSCHRPSIAAIFDGWYLTTYPPVRCPKTSCTGMITATSATPPAQHQPRFSRMAAPQRVPGASGDDAHARGQECGEQHMRPADAHDRSGGDRPPILRHDLAVDHGVTERHLDPAVVAEDPERRQHRA